MLLRLVFDVHAVSLNLAMSEGLILAKCFLSGIVQATGGAIMLTAGMRLYKNSTGLVGFCCRRVSQYSITLAARVAGSPWPCCMACFFRSTRSAIS